MHLSRLTKRRQDRRSTTMAERVLAEGDRDDGRHLKKKWPTIMNAEPHSGRPAAHTVYMMGVDLTVAFGLA